MTTLVLEIDPTVANVTITNDQLTVDLADGRRLMVPLAWYPRLLHASPSERQNWQLLNRTTEHWYTQAASCEISSCVVSAARSASTAAVTSGV
jgi:hypothetical protein